MTVEIDRLPPVNSGMAAVVVASLCTALLGLYSLYAAPFGALAMVAAAGTTFRGWRRAATLTGVFLFLGAMVSGVLGAPTVVVVAGVGGSVVAWDLLDNAVSLGEQLGREADTSRAELVHAAGSVSVGAVVSLCSYGLYQVAGGGRPLAALVFLLLGAVALTSVLRS
ncbi:DUF7519 family protein [Halostella litorea]|uniref:DUF7519 family protein n=1 Tax=Halostella litorea TaxID=2528831 RepID=UPI0010923327|nr:hypothetical protein [Halostella litorea]